eukprot:1160544-Pelagomonas_calceolata.AAC.7
MLTPVHGTRPGLTLTLHFAPCSGSGAPYLLASCIVLPQPPQAFVDAGLAPDRPGTIGIWNLMGPRSNVFILGNQYGSMGAKERERRGNRWVSKEVQTVPRLKELVLDNMYFVRKQECAWIVLQAQSGPKSHSGVRTSGVAAVLYGCALLEREREREHHPGSAGAPFFMCKGSWRNSHGEICTCHFFSDLIRTHNALPFCSFASRYPEALEEVYGVLPEFEDGGLDDSVLFEEVGKPATYRQARARTLTHAHTHTHKHTHSHIGVACMHVPTIAKTPACAGVHLFLRPQGSRAAVFIGMFAAVDQACLNMFRDGRHLWVLSRPGSSTAMFSSFNTHAVAFPPPGRTQMPVTQHNVPQASNQTS